MTQRNTGIYRILDSAAVYERIQRLLGGTGARRRFVRECIRPPAAARILDIGCGVGTILDALPADVDYTGYDLNPKYVDEARRRYAGRAQFSCAKIDDSPEQPAGFDIVLAMGLLHHLTDAEAQRLMATAARQLRAGGVLVTVDPVRHPGQSPVARLLVALDRGRNVRTPEGYRALAGAHFGEVETTLLTDLIPIPYSHFVMRAAAGTRGAGV